MNVDWFWIVIYVIVMGGLGVCGFFHALAYHRSSGFPPSMPPPPPSRLQTEVQPSKPWPR